MVMNMLRMKRIYEPPRDEDGFRILIDESWPEDLSKEEAKVDLWLKEIAPTNFGQPHEEYEIIHMDGVEAKYHEYRTKSFIKIIRDTEREKGTVTFLYSTIKSLMQLQL